MALGAVGFGRKRPARPTAVDMARVIRSLGLLQIDSVNVLVPAHYMVMFARLGPYDRAALDKLIYRSGKFTEQWAHVASIVPMETWPLLKHRMEAHSGQAWGHGEFQAQYPEYLSWVLEEVRRRGPLCGEHLDPPEGSPRRVPGSWYSNVGRATLEAHFARGVVAVTNRLGNFAREFDLAERVIPEAVFGRAVPKEDAQREMIRQASHAYGVATAADLADYFRMRPQEARARIAELVSARELEVVRVEGWKDFAYLEHSAKVPKAIKACALLSPFDPVLWFRPRTERLFDFYYRIEIYVPEAKRKFGYYVLPFLDGERLVGRVDLKADRASGRLLVLAAHAEPGCGGGFEGRLMAELRLVAEWLGLTKVEVGRHGKLAPALRKLT